jgi:hypothetical protein
MSSAATTGIYHEDTADPPLLQPDTPPYAAMLLTIGRWLVEDCHKVVSICPRSPRTRRSMLRSASQRSRGCGRDDRASCRVAAGAMTHFCLPLAEHGLFPA